MVRMNSETGRLEGNGVIRSVKKVGQLDGVFSDKAAFDAADKNQTAYEVEVAPGEKSGTAGGLFWGVSRLFPGKIGREYFMTSGHFHAKRETAEYYYGMQGEGMLLLMDEKGECRTEKVCRGSLHYIPGAIAHRLVNTGKTELVVAACWPSDAGHDYGSIKTSGFPIRIEERDGKVCEVRNV